VPGATDLREVLAAARPEPAALDAAVRLVRRMHDVGLLHPDLNLGNLLAAPAEGGRWNAWVVDLDRASLAPGPLGAAARRRSLRRLDRSYLKLFGAEGPLGVDPWREWVRMYAGGDAEVAAALSKGRGIARLKLALHRLRWR
jgi:hypothetical protein